MVEVLSPVVFVMQKVYMCLVVSSFDEIKES